jgi:hypothetical protein
MFVKEFNMFNAKTLLEKSIIIIKRDESDQIIPKDFNLYKFNNEDITIRLGQLDKDQKDLSRL